MKRIKFLNLLVIGLALTCVVAGCRKKPVAVTPIPPGRTGPAETTEKFPPIERPEKPSSANEGIPVTDQERYKGWPEDAEMFKTETVYFDFDSSAIKSSEKSKIETVGSYLKGSSSAAIKIEGHCDERGTEEYNRSLGERRALAVREELVRLGIAPDRVVTVTYGKDRPVDPGHNEAAWRKNRRGVFILLTPPR